MSYFDGIFLVNDVYQYRLAEAWPTYGYLDPIPTAIDPLYYLTKFVATKTNISYPFSSDIGANNLNLTVLGDAKAAKFSPYESGYYSAYFDGSGDYLSVTIPGGLGTGDWTIEGWVNFATSPGNNGVFHIASAILPSTSSASIAMAGYNAPQWNLYNGAAIGTADTGPVIQKNRWYHFARTRYNGSLITYVDGNQIHTPATDSSDHSSYNSVAIGGYYSGSYLMVGYISNFRIIRGASVYRGNFTPPTAPLTANVVPSIYASNANIFTSVSGANTFLLACNSSRFIDSSANAYTITVNGDTRIVAADPFTPNVSYSNYGSVYFDGTGDSLTIPAGTHLQFTGDYTIEFWIYFTSVSGTQDLVSNYVSSTSADWTILISTTFQYYPSSAASAVVGPTVIANRWYHVAAVRTGTTCSLYVDGVRVGTSLTFSGTLGDATRPAYIGSRGGSSNFTSGYMADVRITKSAVYTGNFIPPTAPILASGSSLPYTSTANVNTTFASANVSVLTAQNNQPHNNTTFLDKSNYRQLITRNGNANQGTVSPYKGSWSNFFPNSPTGTSGFFVPDNPGFDFSNGDFTVEAYINLTASRPTGGSTAAVVYGQVQNLASNSNRSHALQIFNTALTFYYTTNGGTDQTINWSYTFNFNTWYHVAVARSGNNIYGFVNGVLISSQSFNVTIFNSSAPLAVGLFGRYPIDNAYTSLTFPGYISNLRIVKGTALYTSNFIPSTSPLTAVPGTALLTCQSNRLIDISQNNFTVTTNGGVAISSESPFSPAYTQPTPVSYSVAFDGTGDTISTPFNSAISVSTGDFTMEAWCYPTTTTNGIDSIWGSGNYSVMLYHNGTAWTLEVGDGGGNYFTIAGTASLNEWHHMAVTRSGSTFNLWIDGVSAGTGTTAGALKNSGTLFIGGNGNGQNFTGYMSNFRLVKGTAVYTGNFTRPILPLTLSGTSAIYSNAANVNTTFAAANTRILTCHAASIFNAGNALYSNVDIAGDAKPLMGNPFGFNTPSLVDYAANTYGGSVYFDGNGDYLTLPSSTLYDLVGDFTVEAWVYPTRLNANDWFPIDARASGASATPWLFGLTNSSGYKLRLYTGSDYFGASVIPSNVWTHIAWERNGSVLTGYVNGARDYYNASFGTGAISPGATAPRINSKDIGLGAAYDAQGYISDLRFTNSVALYKGPFVPSQIPLQPLGNTTVMLNFTDAAVKDYTFRNNMETMGDLEVVTANSKFGGSSLYFDGTGDYGNISLVSNTLILGTSDFTAEMWINPYSNTTTTYPMTIGSEATGRLNIITVNGALLVNLFGSPNANLTLTGPRIPANLWSHIAVVRANANIRGYYNGNVLPNVTYSNSSVIGNGPLRLGSDSTGLNNFFGFMDEVRITANARYTANFTPAIAVLPTR